MKTSISVKHNFETAHRLSLTPGKCAAIHGHSWWCTLTLEGEVDETGKVEEFRHVKEHFRHYLDSNYDHHLLLFEEDPLIAWTEQRDMKATDFYPGLVAVGFDPTTENIAREICNWAKYTFIRYRVDVELWETATNCAAVWDVGEEQ